MSPSRKQGTRLVASIFFCPFQRLETRAAKGESTSLKARFIQAVTNYNYSTTRSDMQTVSRPHDVSHKSSGDLMKLIDKAKGLSI